VGKVTAQVIEDNPKRWSGDHSVDPALVPGVLCFQPPPGLRRSRYRGHGPHRARSVRRDPARLDGREALVWRVMKLLAAALLPVLFSACSHHGKAVIVLGVDGMDPNFVERHWSALPNLRRLRDLGGLTRLATTTPPQSPVAWATFITGTDPAQHGIFDFVHRDPATMQPISSMAETIEPAHQLAIGPYLLPLSKARVRSFRSGRAFWEILAEHGIPVTMIRMPTNYPPDSRASSPAARSPGWARRISRARSARSPITPTIVLQFILRQGEWSPWIRVRFPLIPHVASVAAMFRLYARELQPGFRVYRSPLNADPTDPALPISAPAHWSRELAARVGPFYTQGIEEDTSALRQGALTLPEYIEQSQLISEGRRRMLRDCLNHFHDGFLFFYFSEVDQNSHVLWGRHDAELLGTYRAIDRMIGDVLDRAHGATVIVMSDHGFAAFDYAVNLNTWLRREGFGTRAYAMGLNALYVNLAGREKHGTVQPGAERDAVIADLIRKLRDFRDPATGRHVVAEVTSPSKSSSRYAPDLIVGYAPPYRASWETALGAAPPNVIEPNIDAWIGDHCMAASAVPGVLLGTRRPRLADPSLKDLPVTILKEFGIAPGAAMTGRDIY
jgi:predicted AlkP superfamily phosphohydrolase/phosphomutase